jgi:CHAT domain-containing protein
MESSSSAPARTACSNLPVPATLSADGEAAVFRALLSMSDGAMLEGNRDIAQRCLAAAKPYAIAPRRELRLANAMGTGFIESGDPVRARESFVRALNVADQAGLAATHQNREFAYLGLAEASLLAHQPGEALRYSAHTLMLASTRADVGQVVDALQVLAMSLREAGERQRALQTLRAAVNLIEQVPIDDLDAETRATYLATQHRVFEELTDILVENALANTSDNAAGGQTWAAFAAAERGRARSLQYAISQATNNDPLNVHAHSAAQYQELVSHIAAVAASTDTAAGWNAVVGQLETLSTAGRETPEPINAEQLLPQLDRLNATLVGFATGRNDMFAFVIDGGDIHVVPLGNRKRISAAAADFYERLHDPEGADEDIRRAAQRLAQLVLWPVTRYVHRERVIFIADDSLHTVPFAVLPWSQDAHSPLVLQHAETAVVPSALFMMQHPDARRALGAAPRFELIGDPIFQASDWRRDCSERAVAAPEHVAQQTRSASDWSESVPRLPGSRAEVLAIADLARAAWPSSHIGVHLGCMATPTALRQTANTGPDLLHIATHGYIDALRPRLSALALTRESATSPTGGIFGLLDILESRTTSRFVVLSACDTSRGRLLPGEGLLGLAQAFLQSGATSVVASYWRIDDAATVSFMRTFYKYLLTEHLPVATALRRAQLEQLPAGTAHNWAAFALFGWPDSSL